MTSLVFFTDDKNDVYRVNCGLNVVDATMHYKDNPNFIMAMPLEKARISMYIPFVMRVAAGHTNTPVLNYTTYRENAPRHNECFHPFAYIRCNNNVAQVPVRMYALILGKSIPVDITVVFPMNGKLAELLNQADNAYFEKVDDKVRLRIGDNMQIHCEVIFPE